MTVENGAAPVRTKTVTLSWTQLMIAFSIVGAFIATIFTLFFRPPTGLDTAMLAVLNILIGALVAKFGTVVDFFFGSSQGSKEKDDAQTRMVERMTPLALPHPASFPMPAVGEAAVVTATTTTTATTTDKPHD